MHLLAHALLAEISLSPGNSPRDTARYVTGSIMADFFSGQNLQDYPGAIRQSILQHRAIDEFTDQHPVFQRSRSLIAAGGAPRFTSGILADIFWGHILAADWAEFAEPLCGSSLKVFSSRVYRNLEITADCHSPQFTSAARWISDTNFLEVVAERDGIVKSLNGLSRRLRGAELLPQSIRILDRNIHVLSADFRAFWPKVLEFSRMTVH